MVQSNTLYAPKTGLYLPGTSGNYVSTPDHASLDWNTNLSLVSTVSLNDLTSIVPTFVSKWLGTGDQRSFIFRATPSSSELYMQVITYPDGTNDPLLTLSSVPLNSFMEVGQKVVLAVIIVPETKIIFFYNKNNYWIKLDEVNINETVFKSSAEIQLGALAANSNNLPGNIFKTNYYIDCVNLTNPESGTLVAEADFSYPWVNNKYTDATGKVWTINGSAWAWEYQDDPEDKYGFTGVG